jgi:gliding motility-associated-like protein
VADFMPEPGQASIFDPEIQLVETSYDAVNWQWDFGDSTYSNLSDPIHLYTQPGTYTVTLMVQNVNGCMDTVTRIVIIEDETTLWIPSAFSPNGDGKNEVFLVRGYGFTDFRLDIFDRWGLLLFSSDNAETGWDGTYNNGKCETDVYVYRVRFRDADNTPHDQVGRVTVVY